MCLPALPCQGAKLDSSGHCEINTIPLMNLKMFIRFPYVEQDLGVSKLTMTFLRRKGVWGIGKTLQASQIPRTS